MESVLSAHEGNNIGEFFHLTGAANAAVDEINSEMDELMEEYQEIAARDDGSWAEYRTFVESNSQYINLLVHSITYPTYGTQGDITSFTYDIANQRALDAEDCLAEYSLTESKIASLFADYYSTADDSAPYRSIIESEVEGCVRQEDGSAEFYLNVETEPKADAPDEYQTSSSNALYVYSTADGGFTAFTMYSDGTDLS